MSSSAPVVITCAAEEQRPVVRKPVVDERAFAVARHLARGAAAQVHEEDLLRAGPVAHERDAPPVAAQAREPVPGGVEREARGGAADPGDAPEVSAPGEDEHLAVGRQRRSLPEADLLGRQDGAESEKNG